MVLPCFWYVIVVFAFIVSLLCCDACMCVLASVGHAEPLLPPQCPNGVELLLLCSEEPLESIGYYYKGIFQHHPTHRDTVFEYPLLSCHPQE